MSQRTRIQTALLQAAKTGAFFHVTYRDDGTPNDIDFDGKRIAPTSCLTNEIDSNFSLDQKMGRKLIRRRDTWNFKLILVFPVEVTGEKFEQDLLDKSMILPADPTIGMPVVELNLSESEYTHPTTHDPANGSRIEFTFEAVEGRR